MTLAVTIAGVVVAAIAIIAIGVNVILKNLE